MVLAVCIVGVYYFIFSKDEWKGDVSTTNVVVSEDQKYLESLTQKEIQKEIFYGMPERVLKPEFGGKVFCASELYGFDKDPDELSINIYLYGYCEEYYIKGETVTLGVSFSTPMRIVFKVYRQELVFDSLTAPKDGGEYTDPIEDIIPEKYVGRALQRPETTKMIPSPKTQAENYYTGKLEVYF